MFVCPPATQFGVMHCNKLFGEVTERASVPPINPCHIAAKYHPDRLYKLRGCVVLNLSCFMLPHYVELFCVFLFKVDFYVSILTQQFHFLA